MGAPQIREDIKNNLYEIEQKMLTQEEARKEKESKKILRAAKEKREHQEYKRIEREEKTNLVRVLKHRKPIIENKFSGINFQYNANKKNHSRAKKECEEHYLNISLESQTCSCENFDKYNSMHQKYDMRRLCSHLSSIIRYGELLKKSKNEIENFILENMKGDTLGVFLDKLEDDRDFAIIAYSSSADLFVATPKTNKEGYLMVNWFLKYGQWSAKNGGKKINAQIEKTITNLFKE